MEPSYKRDGDHTYLVLPSPERVTGNEYPIRMLLENEISGLLACSMRMVDGRALFYYEITSRQSLVRAFDGEKMGKEDMERLLEGIRRGVEEAEGYLLDRKDLLLAPEYIYMDPDRKDVFLCVLPFSEGSAAQGFCALAEYLLKSLDHSDREAVLWGYEIYSMAQRDNFSLDEILRSTCPQGPETRGEQPLEKLDLHPYEEENQQICSEIPDHGEGREKKGKYLLTGAVGCAAVLGTGAVLRLLGLGWTQVGGVLFFILGFFGILLKQMWEKSGSEREEKKPRNKKRVSSRSVRRMEAARWQEEDAISDRPDEPVGETRVLSFGDISWTEAALIRADGGTERFILTKNYHIIGKLKERADLVIEEPEVSRIHAKIEREGDGYYLMDLNSRNGTYVNGVPLEAEESRRLKDQDRIRFGSAVYFFQEQLAQEEEIHYNETIT